MTIRLNLKTLDENSCSGLIWLSWSYVAGTGEHGAWSKFRLQKIPGTFWTAKRLLLWCCITKSIGVIGALGLISHLTSPRCVCIDLNVIFIMRQTQLYRFDIHGSVHRRLLSRNTNKMQLCNRIYYSNVYWRLNMFRAAHRSSSGALNCICSPWFIYPCGDRPLPKLIFHSALTTAGHHMGI